MRLRHAFPHRLLQKCQCSRQEIFAATGDFSDRGGRLFVMMRQPREERTGRLGGTGPSLLGSSQRRLSIAAMVLDGPARVISRAVPEPGGVGIRGYLVPRADQLRASSAITTVARGWPCPADPVPRCAPGPRPADQRPTGAPRWPARPVCQRGRRQRPPGAPFARLCVPCRLATPSSAAPPAPRAV